MKRHPHAALISAKVRFALTQEQKILATATLATITLLFLWNLPQWLPSVWKLLHFRFRRSIGIRVGKVHIPDQARLRHTHIVGATGTGKTVLLEKLLFEDLKRGSGAIVIDPKGERSFYERVRDYCHSIGRGGDLHLLSATYPKESSIWNPCALGSASELQTKFYNSAVYSEPHYAKACEYALGTAFTQLFEKHGRVTLEALRAEFESLCKGPDKDTFQGLHYDLGNLSSSEWKYVLNRTENDPRPELSLLDVIRKNKILFVDLPTEGKRVQSSRIGRLLTQEIILISGMRKRNSNYLGDCPFSVFIDEFDAFATESFSSFLNKGRSSQFMIHLAHQTLSDLRQVSPEFEGQILGNCNVRFIFRQDDPDDAERWSRFLGTKTTIKKTYRAQNGQTTGDSSNREAQEFNVPPDQIKELPVGRCVFSMKTEGVICELKIPFGKERPLPHVEPELPDWEPPKPKRPAQDICSENIGELKWNDLQFFHPEWNHTRSSFGPSKKGGDVVEPNRARK